MPVFRADSAALTAPAPLASGRLSHLAVTFDGTTACLFVDGKLAALQAMATPALAGTIAIAPALAGKPHFAGALAGALVDDNVFDPAGLFAARPHFAVVQFRDVGIGWPFQQRANIGLIEQQDPWLLPSSAAPPSAQSAKPVKAEPVLAVSGPTFVATYDWD